MTLESLKPIDALIQFLQILEEDRLNLAEAISNGESGYTIEDLEKLAIQGAAIQSIKGAIEYKSKR